MVNQHQNIRMYVHKILSCEVRSKWYCELIVVYRILIKIVSSSAINMLLCVYTVIEIHTYIIYMQCFIIFVQVRT